MIIIIIILHANSIICKKDTTLLCLTLHARVLRAYTCTHAQSTDSFTYNTYSRFRWLPVHSEFLAEKQKKNTYV